MYKRLIVETVPLNRLSNGIKVLLIFVPFFDEITTLIISYIIYIGDLSPIKAQKRSDNLYQT